MKCFLLITFLLIAINSYSQITLHEKDASLDKTLSDIRTQTKYVFLYDEHTLNVGLININVSNASLNTVLSTIFKDYPIEFTIVNNNVLLKPKTTTAEQPPVTGRITGDDGQPLPAVTIRVQRTGSVATSDKDGGYKVNARESDVLIFSSIGYKTRSITVGKQQVINVILTPQISSLNDVTVMVGYGSTKKKDLTGSVSSVKASEIRDIPFASIDQALAGKAAGVQVTQADGSPGAVASIRIRGGTSILGGNDPLYIIDGIPVTPQNNYLNGPTELIDALGQTGADNPATSLYGSFARGLNSLAGLNINDIETIDILKDASATAIYGSKAANGVVIITTKKGKYNQPPVFQVDNYTGLSKAISPKLLNADQYRTIIKEAAQNLNDEILKAYGGQVPPDATATQILNNPDFLGNANTNWMKLVLRNGLTQNTDISLRGGSQSSRYYMSLNYSRQTGTVIGTDFSRLSGKLSLDDDISEKFHVQTNLNYAFFTNNITDGVFSQAQLAPPTRAPRNPDGSLATLDGTVLSYGIGSGIQNPLALLNGINQGQTANLQGSLALEYDILKTLKFRSQASVNYQVYNQRNYIPSSALVASPDGGSMTTQGGQAQRGESTLTDQLYENTLTYDKYFNSNSHLNIVAGTSWELFKKSSFLAAGQTFPDDNVLNNIGQAALTLPSTSTASQNSLLSFYLRGNYDLNDKYLLTFTGRADASSKFAPGNQVGYFPSAGIGWRISKEHFMQGITWLDELKLRASAGYTGTQNIGDYLYRTLYTASAYNGINATIPTQLGNNRIKWESTLQKDAGVSFSIFKSRLSGELGVYEKSSSGLLYYQTLPSSAAYTQLIGNIAGMKNKGIEIALHAEVLRSKAFSWTSDFNISFNKNRVTRLNTPFTDPHSSGGIVSGIIFSNTILAQGLPAGEYIGYKYLGVAKTEQEVTTYKASNSSWPVTNPFFGIGDPMFGSNSSYAGTPYLIAEDLGINAQPKAYGGLTNTFSYRNFSLMTLFTFSFGGHTLYLPGVRDKYVVDLTNKSAAALNRWTPTNTQSDRPQFVYGYNRNMGLGTGVTDHDIFSSSYVKLKSISLNYQFPSAFTDRIKMKSASAYISAANVFTVTRYPGLDPETSNDPYSLINGYTDAGMYPAIRQYTFGFRLGF